VELLLQQQPQQLLPQQLLQQPPQQPPQQLAELEPQDWALEAF